MSSARVSSLSRMTYRLILRVHPGSFRERFGDEMLWIFDEEMPARRWEIVVDGALSAVRQHAEGPG